MCSIVYVMGLGKDLMRLGHKWHFYIINTVFRGLCKTNAKTASVFMVLSNYIFHEFDDIIDEILLTN